MNETYVTVTGNLVADPEHRVTRGGQPFSTFRLASTVRRRTREGGFEDVQTNYFNVAAFRSLGVNAAGSLRKGMPVVVHGRLRINQWQRSDQTYGTSVEVEAYSIGPDLTWGTADFTKVMRAQTSPDDALGDPDVQESLDRAAGVAPMGTDLGAASHVDLATGEVSELYDGSGQADERQEATVGS